MVEHCNGEYGVVASHTIVLQPYVHSLSINDGYPELGEEVTITSVATTDLDYQIKLKYSLWGQTQRQHVSNVLCENSSSNSVDLWTNSALAYQTVTIEAWRFF